MYFAEMKCTPDIYIEKTKSSNIIIRNQALRGEIPSTFSHTYQLLCADPHMSSAHSQLVRSLPETHAWLIQTPDTNFAGKSAHCDAK